jgi:hypothetical protein
MATFSIHAGVPDESFTSSHVMTIRRWKTNAKSRCRNVGSHGKAIPWD